MVETYEEVVNGIPLTEKPLGPLAGLATRLDYIGPKVEKLANELSLSVDKLEHALRTVEFPGIGVISMHIEQVPFSYTLSIAGSDGSGVTLREVAPFSGLIKQVTVHWPEGCNALVDVKVGHGVRQFCPNEGYLSLNDATPTYPFNEWVDDREEIWVELRNRDGANTHTITVTVTLEGNS